MSKPILLLFMGLIVVSILVSCTSSRADRGLEVSGAVTPVASPVSGELGADTGVNLPSDTADASASEDVAPDFTIIVYQGGDVLGGSQVSLSQLIGKGKPVVINFWAGLCPPCRVEMPELQKFYDENKDSVLLIGVDIGPFVGLGSIEDGKKLLRELEVSFPAGTTLDPEIVNRYKVTGLPVTHFITSDGKRYTSWFGALNGNILKRVIGKMVE